MRNYIIKTCFLFTCNISRFFKRCVTDFSFRLIDNSCQTYIIIRIIYNSQICNYILNFFTVIESKSRKDFVRNRLTHKHFFYYTRLCICSVQYRTIRKWTLFIEMLFYLTCNISCLVIFVCTRVYKNFISVTVWRPQRFTHSTLIVRYNAVCGIKDILRWTVILVKRYLLYIRVIIFKIKNISDICTSEFINTLVVITDNAKISVCLCKKIYKKILRIVRILILINKYVLKLILIFWQYIGIFT